MSVRIPIRRQAELPPVGQAFLVMLGALTITGAIWLWAVAMAPADGRALLAWSLGVIALLLCVAVAFAAYSMLQGRLLRDRLAGADGEIARLADHTLPALVYRLREGASAETALAEISQPPGLAQQRIMWMLAQEIGKGERMRAATMSACANAAGRVQALATSMLADLREMEDRHDEKVLGDLLKLDHSTAQAGRLADSIAVLTGARSGRRWTKPIVMESILRGAVGRISAYQRVRVHSASAVSIAGYAAEGVMHALAELMDNAATFSPPSEEVHVYVEEVTSGMVVTIEDCGLVMSPAALSRARRAVSSEPLDLTTLSGTRLGLAVVGCLARKHGLTISFRPSSRGGTGVVVMIPQRLIMQIARDPIARDPVVETPRSGSVRAPRVAAPMPAESEPATPVGDGELYGLPKRHRGQTLAAASSSASQPSPSPSPSPTKPRRPRSDPGAGFSAFRQASLGAGAGGASLREEDDAL